MTYPYLTVFTADPSAWEIGAYFDYIASYTRSDRTQAEAYTMQVTAHGPQTITARQVAGPFVIAMDPATGEPTAPNPLNAAAFNPLNSAEFSPLNATGLSPKETP